MDFILTNLTEFSLVCLSDMQKAVELEGRFILEQDRNYKLYRIRDHQFEEKDNFIKFNSGMKGESLVRIVEGGDQISLLIINYPKMTLNGKFLI